ncbi:MAG TPA: hypothetical protein VEH86_00030 [Candidatus Acidoferrum sp.]|nr:hypothetical protein [Candidatus Acidoferrum sp.]
MKFSDRFVSLSEFLFVLAIVGLGIVGLMLFSITYNVLLWIALIIGYILGKKF